MDGRLRDGAVSAEASTATRPDGDALSPGELQFLQDVSHELRAPLTVALGHLELVIDERGDDVIPAVILDELTRMGRIIDDLQGLALAGVDNFLAPETLETVVLGDELLLKSSALASQRRWALDRVDSVTFVADRDRLTEAVLNLVDNAVGATADGDRISLAIRRHRGELALSVSDTGSGIEPEDLGRVLQRFERGGQARRRYRGAGLGLSVVQAIASAHGGRLQLESEVGRGTTATLFIELIEPEAAS